jgi:PadR family transcriptional regulator PadR
MVINALFSPYCHLTILYDIQYNVDMIEPEIIKGHVTQLSAELRRGLIVLVVMSQLETKEYGYSLLRKLEEKGFELTQDTLYPLLRRLESQGYLQSDWIIEDARPRRYYQLNELGTAVMQALRTDWQQQLNVIKEIIR